MSSSAQLAPPPLSPASNTSRPQSRGGGNRSNVYLPRLTPGTATPDTIGLSDEPPVEIDQAPLPAFLQFSAQEIRPKWTLLDRVQHERYINANQEARWARPNGAEVKTRNRYNNVDPYLENRIKLRVPPELSDYINASPIVLRNATSGRVRNYIASQGPLSSTKDHFWRMLWQETTDPAVILMLTQTHDAGREKCTQYFPDGLSSLATIPINPTDEFSDGLTGSITLISLMTDPATQSTIRQLELSMTTADGETETRKVWHILFEGWPDFQVPEDEDRAALLALLETSASINAEASGPPQGEDSQQREGDNPRIVHCSAGIGRTGTLIALDWLLGELVDGFLDDIADDVDPVIDVVETLREQRMMMVQSESQLRLIYDVLREQWVRRWRHRTGQMPPELEESMHLATAPESPAKSESGAADANLSTSTDIEAAIRQLRNEEDKGS